MAGDAGRGAHRPQALAPDAVTALPEATNIAVAWKDLPKFRLQGESWRLPRSWAGLPDLDDVRVSLSVRPSVLIGQPDAKLTGTLVSDFGARSFMLDWAWMAEQIVGKAAPSRKRRLRYRPVVVPEDTRLAGIDFFFQSRDGNRQYSGQFAYGSGSERVHLIYVNQACRVMGTMRPFNTAYRFDLEFDAPGFYWIAMNHLAGSIKRHVQSESLALYAGY
ncbi:MAG: hypothetical protein AB8F65_00560 [Woeseiaceae bacterium]